MCPVNLQTLEIVMFGYSDAANSVSLIDEGFTKGFDDASQDISVKIGTVAPDAVVVGEITEPQPASNNVTNSGKL